MTNETCISCLTPMNSACDADPNGDMGCVCARCSAEEKHDYDVNPRGRYNRRGELIDDESEPNDNNGGYMGRLVIGKPV